MKKKEIFLMVNNPLAITNHRKGVVLIVVIMVLAFLLTVGIMLVSVTGTGPKVAGNVRLQLQAFNAAEAGVDTAWKQIGEYINNEVWDDFSGQYRTTFNNQPGLDDPSSQNYFRRLTNQQLVEDVLNNPDNFIFASQPLPNDNKFTYTVFLINDEGGGGVQDNEDSILVCIGKAPLNTYTRLEIEIEIQSET